MCPSIRRWMDGLIDWLAGFVRISRYCYRHDRCLVSVSGMALLMSDNVDRCFEMWGNHPAFLRLSRPPWKCVRFDYPDLMAFLSFRYPPKTFIPPLCAIFLDVSAPDSILEVTARALTYYLDVSQECTRRILSVGSFYTHAFVFDWLKFTHYFSCVLTLSNHVYAETIFSPVNFDN